MATRDLERFHLDVRRGRTRHPSRPIDRDGFLVGSGPDCQLRLGDDGIALRHCRLRLDGDAVHIERIAPAPALVVNGEVVDAARLEDGASVTIGSFQFELRDTGTCEESLDAGELSAADLVDRLEDEFALVDEYESRRAVGLEALLEATRHVEPTSPIVEATRVDELIQRLESFATELEDRVARLADREQRLLAASNELLAMQEALERRLVALEERPAKGKTLPRAA